MSERMVRQFMEMVQIDSESGDEARFLDYLLDEIQAIGTLGFEYVELAMDAPEAHLKYTIFNIQYSISFVYTLAGWGSSLTCSSITPPRGSTIFKKMAVRPPVVMAEPKKASRPGEARISRPALGALISAAAAVLIAALLQANVRREAWAENARVEVLPR